jgi:adenine-specific DNA-methyltransferase
MNNEINLKEEFLQSILDEILSNEKQKEEWKELFEI